jgi:hypothetical protein
MYLVLLVFGLVLSVAGVALAASGVSLHDRIFDMTVVTPGIVAAVGGLLLVGLGLALRLLRRIEQSLATRPMPRVARPGETVEPSLASDGPSEARIPFPPKANSRTQSAAIAAAAFPAVADGRQQEDLPEKQPAKILGKTPALARLESTKIVEEADLPLSSMVPSNVDEASEAAGARIARRRNGAAPARITPRLDMNVRSQSATERPKGPAFDALWPKGQRPARPAQPAPPQEGVVIPAAATLLSAAPVVEPEQNDAPVPDTFEAVAAVAADETVSVLKSGVVDGMAYTLFSDGSIEAGLPQGTLRFGSITELRNHIEQSA